MDVDEFRERVAAFGTPVVCSSSSCDKDLILSLLSAPKPSTRSRILNLLATNRPPDSSTNHLLGRIFLNFTKDPFPYVRKSALEGMASLVRFGCGEISGLYDRAIELLMDDDELVRSAAVRLVGVYGQMLSASDDAKDHGRLDEMLLRLCSMGRDMCVEVKVEAFSALGRFQHVSEDVLLQTVSKRVLGAKNEKEFVSLVASAAGAFVHGLEDEFYEVRAAACASLGMLSIISPQFANQALSLLMDLLNDDTLVVRLKTLETLFTMASYGHLKVQEAHMHMFLSVLMDTGAPVRRAARRLLCAIKLIVMEMFKSAITGLQNSLERYPEDEAEILSVLYIVGRNHEKFASRFVKEFAEEGFQADLSSKGDLVLGRPRTIVLFLLTLSAQIPYNQIKSGIPLNAFQCSLPLLGKMSLSLADMIKCNLHNHTCPIPFPLKVVHGLLDETAFVTPFEEYQQKVTFQKEEALSTIKLILAAVAQTWPLTKSGHVDEACNVLRNCKEELAKITVASHEYSGAVSFAFKYVKVIKLLTRIWQYLEPRKSQLTDIGSFDILLQRLVENLLSLRYSFLGLRKGEEFHIVELMLLSSVIHLSKIGVYNGLTWKRLSAYMKSHLELLSEKADSQLSVFLKELRQSLSEVRECEISSMLPSRKLIELFSLEHFEFGGTLKFRHAVLNVHGNDSENPLPFVAGLPVGIRCQITLYNISNENRLWLQMVVGNLVQYVFLDLDLFEGSDDCRKGVLDLPFYRTPKACSFSMWACIGLECPSENITCKTGGRGGPKRELTFLCKEREVLFIEMMYKREKHGKYLIDA